VDALRADDTTHRLSLSGSRCLLEPSQASFSQLLSPLGREYAAKLAGRGIPFIQTAGASYFPNLDTGTGRPNADECNRVQSDVPVPSGALRGGAVTWVLPSHHRGGIDYGNGPDRP
jgi:hypothetical protein